MNNTAISATKKNTHNTNISKKIKMGGHEMLKIRMQGMTSDIEWFQKILEEDKRIRVLGISEPFANKGTNKYFRVYAEVNKKEK